MMPRHGFPGAGARPEQPSQHGHEQRCPEQRIEDAQRVDDGRELDREDHPEHAADERRDPGHAQHLRRVSRRD